MFIAPSCIYTISDLQVRKVQGVPWVALAICIPQGWDEDSLTFICHPRCRGEWKILVAKEPRYLGKAVNNFFSYRCQLSLQLSASQPREP